MNQPLLLVLAALACACRASADIPASPAAVETTHAAEQKPKPAAKPSAAGANAPVHLRLEYLVDPLGIDEKKPRFSFELDDARRGALQLGWQILVAKDRAELDADRGGMWDSGKVETADTCQIVYAGSELQSWSHYWWKVRSWDGANVPTSWSAPAQFGTAALIPADWKGHWICDPAPAPEPPLVPVPASEPEPAPATATEPATANRGWCSQFADKAESYKWIKIDLGQGTVFDTVRLYPANDDDAANTKRALFPIRLTVWGSDYPEFDSITRVFKLCDESAFDVKLPEQGPLELHTLSRMKMHYVLIGFDKLARDERGYAAALAEVEILEAQKVVSAGRPVWTSDSREESGWSAKSINDGVYTSSGGAAANAAPASRGWCSEFADKEDAYKWVKFELGKGTTFDHVRFYPAEAEDGSQTPWALFPPRIKMWGSDRPEFDSLARAVKLIDQGSEDIKLPGHGPLELDAGTRVNMPYVMVGFPKLAKEKRGYGAALAEIEFYDSVAGKVVSVGKPVSSSDSREENGWSTKALDDGVHPGPAAAQHAHADGDGGAGESASLPRQPLLRHEFAIGAPLARATLSCSALGLYEVHLNGKRVTQDVLAPGWSDYRKRTVYDTYDVTSLLVQGPNAIGVQLADGWFAGRVGLTQLFVGGPERALYGGKPSFDAQLELEYADGKRESLSTGEGWKSTLEGPLVSSDLIDGETWDARKELAGWDKPGFDDKSWTPVDHVDAPKSSLNAQRGTPVRVVAELPPVQVKPLGPNRWVFDFGRNVAGWCKLRASAPAGTELMLRHAEALNADGSLYTANLRSAKQTDRYIFKGGGEEVFEPRFTSHGFRYVEASFGGAKPDAKLAQPELVAQVVSNSAELTASFHVQHPVLAKLWENIGTTLRANIQSLPQDCPQRDERLGWMGDIQVFGPTAMLHSDLAAFFTQWTQPVRDAYTNGHRFSDFSPNPFEGEAEFVGAPGWADAGVSLPYDLWQCYGDKRQIEFTLPMMTRWLDAISADNPDFLWKNERGNDYGDWLNGSMIDAPGWNSEGCEVPKEVFATAFFAHSADQVGELAAVLGKNEVADRYIQLADKIRAAFAQAYIQPDGTILGDTQAGYALALSFDLVPKKLVPLVQAKLSVSITEKRAWHMTTGMQTTARMLLELSRRGYEEVASRLARSKEFPGWGWQIEQGATSIWERWDGIYPGRGFADPSMNSLNHYAFGAIGEWLITCVAGIEGDHDNPGYAHFFIHPRAGLQIPGAGARYHSIRGTIESSWRIEGDSFVLDATIPPNTSATVVLPALSVEAVREGGKSVLEASPNVRPLDYQKGLQGAEIAGHASFDVRAGTYHFESQFRIPAPK